MGKILKRISQLILCALLIVTCCAFPLLSIKESEKIGVTASAEDSSLPVVYLRWSTDEEKYKQFGQMMVTTIGDTKTYSLFYEVVAEGQITEDIKITVQTFDVSAKARNRSNPTGEYSPKNATYTLTAQFPNFMDGVVVYNSQLSDGQSVAVARGDGQYHTKLFGLRIVSVSGARVVNTTEKPSSILGRVHQGSNILDLTKNEDAGAYNPTLNDSGEVFKNAMSYNAAMVEYKKTVLDYKYLYGENDYSLASKWKNYINSNFKVTDTYNDYAQATLLKSQFNDIISTYWYVEGSSEQQASVNTAAGLQIRIKDDKEVLYNEGHSTKKNKTKFFHVPGSGTSARRRSGSTDSQNWYVGHGSSQQLHLSNNAHSADKKVYDWIASSMFVVNSKPELTGYSVYDGSYGANSSVYISVHFNRPVQLVQNGAKVQLQTTVGGNEFDLEYVGGNYTDTLVFKGVLTGSYFGSEIEIVGMRGLDQKESWIIDLFWNDMNANNLWEKNIPQVTLPCKIDTRTPEVRVDLNESTTYKKSQTVQVTVRDITADGKLETAWSLYNDISTVNSWTTQSFTPGTPTTVAKSDGTGEFYLHVRATGVSGKQTVKSYGPYYVNNSPPLIQAIYCQDYGAYKEDHTFDITVKTEGSQRVTDLYAYLLDGQGVKVVDNKLIDQSLITSSNQDGNVYMATITLNDVFFGLPENSLGHYKVGFSAKDDLGNIANPTYFAHRVSYDNRDSIEITPVYGDADVTVDGNYSVYYNSTESGEDRAFEVVHTLDGDASGNYLTVAKIFLNGKLIYSGDGDYASGWQEEGKNGESYGIAKFEAISTAGQNTMRSIFTVNQKAQGFFTVVFGFNGKESNAISLFLSQRDATPNNYASLNAPNRLLKNEVWQFATSRYFTYGENNETHYAEGGRTPIFSSFEKAYEYAYFKELQDLAILYLTEDMRYTIVNDMNENLSLEYKKAQADKDVRAEVGQTWVRYKTVEWNVNSSQSLQNWVYYFVGNGNIEKLDGNNLPDSLTEALSNNASEIANEQKGRVYLTSATGGVNSLGQPTYDERAIFFEEVEFAGYGSSSLTVKPVNFENPIKYSGDGEIFSNTVTTGGETYPYVSAFNVTFSDGYGTLLFRAKGATSWNVLENGENFKDKIVATGIYEFAELGKGYKSYFAFVDLTPPALSYEAERNGSQNSGYVVETSSSIVAEKVTVKDLITLQSQGGDGSINKEVDEFAYYYLTNIQSGETIDFVTNGQLKETEGGKPLPSGNYYLYTSDRLGNTTRITVKIQGEGIKINSTVKENRSITFTFNRKAREIDTFEVYLNGALQEVEFADELVFTASGTYRIVIRDIYGQETDEVFDDFHRSIPTVGIRYYSNNTWLLVEPSDTVPSTSTGTFVQRLNDNAYNVVTNSIIRFKFDQFAGYGFEFESGNPNYRYDEVNGIIEIQVASYTEEQMDAIIERGEEPYSNDWVIRFFYELDKSTYVTYSCIHDETPPYITGWATVDQYVYNARNGKDNILFHKDPVEMQVLVADGETLNAKAVEVNWTDDYYLANVRYRKDGGDWVAINSGEESVTLTEKGSYEFEAVDVLGNIAYYAFEIKEEQDAKYLINGQNYPYSINPQEKMTFTEDGYGETYTDTQYTGGEVKITVSGEKIISFMRKEGEEIFVYGIQYNGEWLTIFYIDPDYYENGGNEINDVSGLIEKTTLNGLEGSGYLFNKADGDKFDLRYEYDGEEFAVVIPAPIAEQVFWQWRVTDKRELGPIYMQFVQSNAVPNIELAKKGTQEKISCNNTDFVGVNTAVEIVKSSISSGEVESIIAYRSENFTTDFTNSEQVVLYDGESFKDITQRGYYKVVAKNVYQNEQVFLVKVSFGLETAVQVDYADGDRREYSFFERGEYSVKSNSSVKMMVWELESEISVTKDGLEVTVPIIEDDGSYTLNLKVVGEYVVSVVDVYGNDYTFNLSIKAPEEVAYGNFITGWNEEALLKDQMYSNGGVDLDKTQMDGIGAVGYRYYTFEEYGRVDNRPIRIVYDIISQEKVEYTSSSFTDCIGVDGDGVYEVIFTDFYGNKNIQTVRISTKQQLELTRLTQNSSAEENYSLDGAMEEGAWTNRSLFMYDKASLSLLKVDGEEVTFTNGKYELKYPSSDGEGEKIHQVEYVDEYGNKYSFTVHLYKKSPEIGLIDGVSLLSVDNEIFVKGEIGYVWTDEKVTATYTFNGGEPLPYESGAKLSEDGVYLTTFTDIAGNQSVRRVTVDTKVSYRLMQGQTEIRNGLSVSTTVTLLDDGDQIKVVTAKKDGVEFTPESMTFNEHGAYDILIQDALGNQANVNFTVYKHAVQSFTFVAQEGYAIFDLWLVKDGYKQSYVGNVTVDDNYRQQYYFDMDGDYEITVVYLETEESYTFSVTIDNVAPKAGLEGVENGKSTRNDVTVNGVTKGDSVYVYLDGELQGTYVATSGKFDSPVLSKSGEYKIVIEDQAGNKVEYTFTKEFATNVASNVFILLILLAVVGAELIAFTIRGKVKTK